MKLRTMAACAVALLWALADNFAAAVPIALPVYIEDNHAGSAYWLAQHIDVDDACTLIHFDAHSDATAIFDSDELRTKIRRVYSVEDRAKRLEEWRRLGVFQCFGWIEPLMPAPFAQVIWVPRETLEAPEAARMEGEAAESLDAHLEAAPRRDGSFKERYHLMGLRDLEAHFQEGAPVVVTIDLDYFSGMEPGKQSVAFERVWRFVAGIRNLRAVTFGVSRPYLASDAEAHRLVQLALDAALSVPTAVIEFEPFATVGNDHSLRAEEYRRQGKEVPSYKIGGAPQELRAIILANRDRIIVQHDPKQWNALLKRWVSEAPSFSLELRDCAPSTDGVWRLPVQESTEVVLRAKPWDAAIPHVEWIALTPVFNSCNLTAERADDGAFATGAPPRPLWCEKVLPTNGNMLSPEVLKTLFDATTGCGSARIKARVKGKGWVRETPVMEIKRYARTGFRSALSEQFCLPYLFGSGLLQNANGTGPETDLGADCANFMVYALRRQGRWVPWSDPKQLRDFLTPVAAPAVLGKTAFSKEDVENGLIVHFGNHVAAVVEDRPPLGVLNELDLVAHQLEGLPEVVPLGKLLETRKGKPIDLMRVPELEPEAGVLIGGDVMLARTVGEKVKAGVDPFAGIRTLWDLASYRIVNLECVISDKGKPLHGKPYVFRAPLQSADALRVAKVDAVGVANNHAGDCGEAALSDCVGRLTNQNIAVLGANKIGKKTYAPEFITLPNGQCIAVLALNALDDSISRGQLSEAVEQAHTKADWVLCFVHWGDENTPVVNDEQRQLARWLIDNGVDIIAGSHPHCVQPLDCYHGHPIAYSLGNLVFDGVTGSAEWNHGALLEIGFSRRQPFPSVRLIPIHLDDAGFPEMN